jgi:tRNA nucleotidyltransferase (CCA-adding enzyme)
MHEVLAAVGVLSRDMGSKAYLVGGIVRDIVIGYSNIDLDVVIDGDGVELARAFAAKTGAVFKGPTRFGTSKVESRAFGTIDFATARTESYERPGALPEVERSTIGKDLVRRDFTINAMAISLDPSDYGELVDPFGGLEDVGRRRLRILHGRSLLDDPTRILRGVRFAARYNFRFEANTLKRLKECLAAGCLRSISGKRAYTELRHICADDRPLKGLRTLERYGMLAGIHPGLGLDDHRRELMSSLPRSIESVAKAAGAGFANPWLCWFAALFAGIGRRRAQRLSEYLNLPAGVRDVCLWMSSDLKKTAAQLARLAPAKAYEATSLLKTIPQEAIPHLHAVSSRRGRGLIRRYLSQWRHVAPDLTGGEIASLGIGEGPLVGKMLDEILRLKLEGKIKTRADELNFLRGAGARKLH